MRGKWGRFSPFRSWGFPASVIRSRARRTRCGIGLGAVRRTWPVPVCVHGAVAACSDSCACHMFDAHGRGAPWGRSLAPGRRASFASEVVDVDSIGSERDSLAIDVAWSGVDADYFGSELASNGSDVDSRQSGTFLGRSRRRFDRNRRRLRWKQACFEWNRRRLLARVMTPWRGSSPKLRVMRRFAEQTRPAPLLDSPRLSGSPFRVRLFRDKL